MKQINTVIKYFLAACMLAMTVLTSYQIICRFVLNNASSWSEEGTRFIFVWASFIAAGIGIHEHIHIGIDIVVGLFPEKIRKGVAMFVHFAISVFGVYLSYSGIALMKMTTGQRSPALGYPRGWLYLPILIMGIMCIFYGLLEITLIFKQMKKGGAL